MSMKIEGMTIELLTEKGKDITERQDTMDIDAYNALLHLGVNLLNKVQECYPSIKRITLERE